jgi:hypothetical protein
LTCTSAQVLQHLGASAAAHAVVPAWHHSQAVWLEGKEHCNIVCIASAVLYRLQQLCLTG